MLTIHSFLQSLFKFLKTLAGPLNISKKDYRTAAVIMSGTIVIAVAFNAVGFAGGGKSALASFGEGDLLEGQEDEPLIEENDDTEADIQADISMLWREARLLIGKELVRTVQETIQEETAAIASHDSPTVMNVQAQAMGLEAIPVISFTTEDYDVMLRIVEAEAGSYSAIDKILVANVVINRVLDDKFPDTITEVVYQRSKNTTQFSPVANGSIDRVTVSEDTIECVNRALCGEDYSKGALFFMMRSASAAKNVSWFDRDLQYLFKEGPHEFFTYQQ